MNRCRRFTGRPFWEPGTRVQITHDPAHGTIVANTTDALATTLTRHGLVAAGTRRWHLPDSAHRPADLDAIDNLVDDLRRHHTAVSTRLAAPTAARR